MFYSYDHGKKQTTKGGTTEFEVKNKNVTHLVIKQTATASLTASSFKVKVEAYTKEFSGILVDSLTNAILEHYSDIEFGHPVQTATSKVAVINIGSLRLQNQESISVTCIDTATGTHTVAEFQLISLYANPSMDRVYQYGISKAGINNFNNVNAVILDTAGLSANDSFDIGRDGYNTIMSLDAIKLLDTIQKQNLLDSEAIAVILFDEKMLPHSFNYEYKGSQEVNMYYRRIQAQPSRVQQSLSLVLADKIKIAEGVQVADNQTSKALELGGAQPSVSFMVDIKKTLPMASSFNIN